MERGVLALCVGAFCIAMGLREEINIWVGTGLAASVSIALLWVGVRPRIMPSFGPTTLASVSIGVFVGVAMSFATWWLYPLSLELIPSIEREVATLYTLLRQPPGPIQALPLLFFVVVAEELVWRGLAIDVFSKALGPRRAVVGSAIMYVLPQLAFRSPLLMVIALGCGAVWGVLRVRSDGIAAPLAAHFVWNLLVFVMYPVA